MRLPIAFRILGALLMMFSFTMLPPALVSVLFKDGVTIIFINTFLGTLLAGFLLWLLFRHNDSELRARDGFLITFLFYVALGTVGAFPLVQQAGIGLSWPDALFESLSGLTTTGATVITGLDDLPESILFYRQWLQWLGGMGIIVLAVAILPMLGIGGMQLYRAETPGPVKDSKLTPRITQTAAALWVIYVGLTTFCAFAYWVAGMSVFDAICHSFSTVAIGGFSTHDASIGYFDSPLIESVAMFFMIISGINFSLHFFTLREKGDILHYFHDEEVVTYLRILACGILLVTIILASLNVYEPLTAFRMASFEVVSIFTTTGFATTDFSAWPSILPFLVFFGAFFGACAGSTGGGIKIYRILLIWKQGVREIYRLIHPNAIFPIRINRRPVSSKIVDAVWGFFSFYVIIFALMYLALLATGMDAITAFSAVGASINNLGPGLGDVAYHYNGITDTAKLLLCFTMMLGRLEIFTLLVLFTPMFWEG